jgi:hypothetical protein
LSHDNEPAVIVLENEASSHDDSGDDEETVAERRKTALWRSPRRILMTPERRSTTLDNDGNGCANEEERMIRGVVAAEMFSDDDDDEDGDEEAIAPEPDAAFEMRSAAQDVIVAPPPPARSHVLPQRLPHSPRERRVGCHTCDEAPAETARCAVTGAGTVTGASTGASSGVGLSAGAYPDDQFMSGGLGEGGLEEVRGLQVVLKRQVGEDFGLGLGFDEHGHAILYNLHSVAALSGALQELDRILAIDGCEVGEGTDFGYLITPETLTVRLTIVRPRVAVVEV